MARSFIQNQTSNLLLPYYVKFYISHNRSLENFRIWRDLPHRKPMVPEWREVSKGKVSRVVDGSAYSNNSTSWIIQEEAPTIGSVSLCRWRKSEQSCMSDGDFFCCNDFRLRSTTSSSQWRYLSCKNVIVASEGLGTLQ